MALDPARFKTLLLEKKREFLEQSEKATDARRPVELDQQSVGRLSRQDALQRQAMARAQEQLRQRELVRISKALARLDEGEYGFCLDCGEEIPEKRLDVDPMAELCIRCKQ